MFELAGVPSRRPRGDAAAMHKLPMKCRFVRREAGEADGGRDEAGRPARHRRRRARHAAAEAKEELFNLRFQAATGQLESHGRLRAVRKDIARIYTIMRERELGIDVSTCPGTDATVPHDRDEHVGRVSETSSHDESTTETHRGFRKTREGLVVSDKMDKTVVVAVEDRVKHPLYGKVIRRTNKLKAHDEQNSCGVGDRVLLMETRPLSATKRWRVVEILEKAK
jgi:small subunit ribosomal protein S17